MSQHRTDIATKALWIILAAALAITPLAGCLEDTLEGELVLTPPPSALDDAVFELTLWRYDPMLADSSADRVADLTVTEASGAPVPFSFKGVGAPEPGFGYYITAEGDIDGDGARSNGDFYPSDFGAVDTTSGSWAFASINLAPITVDERACPDAQEHGEAFATSLSAWQEIKAGQGSIYRYTSEWQSFTGARGRTVINVVSDIVTDRSYQVWDGEGTLIDEWSERGAELGSHAAGAPALTLDEVYDVCCSDVLSQSLESNTLYFGVDEETGILETCVFVPSGCADDCDEGLRVSDVAFAMES